MLIIKEVSIPFTKQCANNFSARNIIHNLLRDLPQGAVY